MPDALSGDGADDVSVVDPDQQANVVALVAAAMPKSDDGDASFHPTGRAASVVRAGQPRQALSSH